MEGGTKRLVGGNGLVERWSGMVGKGKGGGEGQGGGWSLRVGGESGGHR